MSIIRKKKNNRTTLPALLFLCFMVLCLTDGPKSLVRAYEGQLEMSLISCEVQNFPFVYLTVQVFEGGHPIDYLNTDNFFVEENGTLQTESFEVIPPGDSGLVRMVDIVFLVDCSNSMAPHIENVRNNCAAFTEDMEASGIDYRLGLTIFGQEDSVQPQMYGDGFADDVLEFNTWLDSLVTGGGIEYGFEAIRFAIQNYNFRTGARKVFILVSDEDSDDRDKQTTIDMILANKVVVYCAVHCYQGYSSSDYCDPTSVSAVSGGLAFSLDDSFDQIFTEIQQEISNTYIVKYHSSNPQRDGVQRQLICTVDNGDSSDYFTCSYVPNALPIIRRTAHTLALHRRGLIAGLSPEISVEIIDEHEPYIQEAKLHVRRVGSGLDFQALTMIPQGGDIYAANVPSNLVNSPGIEYYIRATDGEFFISAPGTDPEMNPYQITVLPNQAPSITHNPPPNWIGGQDLHLEIQADDDTGGIIALKVFYRDYGQLIWRSASVSYPVPQINITETINISSSELTSSLIEYYIKVTDDFNVSGFWPTGGADNPYVLSSNPTLHVLCVGMDCGPALNGAADAQAVHALLQRQPNFALSNPAPLILDPNQTGNKILLNEALSSIADNLTPGDDFLLYFSGHGAFPTSDGNDETPVEIYYGDWILWNMNDEYLGLQSNDWNWPDQLSDDELISNSWLGGAVWDKVDKLVVLDACHAGGFWADLNIIDDGDLEKLPRCALLAAASESGPAFSLPSDGRGLWTSLALEPALFIGGAIDDLAVFINGWDASLFNGIELLLRLPDYFPPDNTAITFETGLWDPVFFQSEDFSLTLSPITATYYLTTQVISGNGTLLPVSGAYDAGTVVTLTAAPDQYYQLKAWYGTADDASKQTTNLVHMDSDKIVSVEFQLAPINLTTQVIGGHGQISPDSGAYAVGTTVTLTAVPDQFYRVKAWHGTDDDSSTSTTNTVYMDVEKTVSVEFEPIPVTLTTIVDGGGGQITPAGGVFDAGTMVTLTATPDPYYHVKAWHGTDDDASTDTTNTVFLDGDKTVSVEFDSIPVYLNINVVGVGGTLPQTSGFRSMGTVETLSVMLQPGYTVKAWQGTDDDSSRASNNTVTMDADKTVTVELASIMAANKCLVKAGKERGQDSLILSGAFHATAQDIAQANAIYVKIWSDTGFSYQPDTPLPFNPDSLKKNRFIHRCRIRKGDPGGIALLKLDFNKHTFLLMARNLNATGLASPVLVDIILGDYVGLTETGEDLINKKKYIPMTFMKYHTDTLRLDKPPVVKVGKKENSDSLLLSGSIAVKSDAFNLAAEQLIITWGNQTFVVPPASFIESSSGQKYICRKITDPLGNGIISAVMDFDKCTFKIRIKDAHIDFRSASGSFGLAFAAFDETIEVNIP